MKDNLIPFPNLVEQYLSQAEERLQEGQLLQAEELVDEILQISPERIEAIYLYAVIQLQAERYVELVDWIEEQKSEDRITATWEEPFQLLYEVASEELQKRIDSVQPVDHDLLESWRKGFFSSLDNQWKAYEQIQFLRSAEVQELIQQYLINEATDALIKTKLLQKLKEEYLRLSSKKRSIAEQKSLMMKIVKEGKEKVIDVMKVPLDLLEWSEQELAPWLELQKKLDQQPSLVYMAQEMWLFFLEKRYPFHQIDGSLSQWTAILHCYTLKLMLGEDWSHSTFDETCQQYELEAKELAAELQQFEELLMANHEMRE